MATKQAFPIKVDSNLHGFTYAIKSAMCEWLLIFLLLLDAAFSFLLTKFAQHCELQLPCILCSRLDHVFGNEKPGFYRNLLCNSHKSEISSLVLCRKHGKLVDVHMMCDECLLSFAKNESNEERYKILVGKLGSDCFEKPLSGLDNGSESLKNTKYCSCCSKIWRFRRNVEDLIQSKPSPSNSRPDFPVLNLPKRRSLKQKEGFKLKKDRLSSSSISSDSESEFPISEDDERNPKMGKLVPQKDSNFVLRSQNDEKFPELQCQKSSPTPITSKLMFSKPDREKLDFPENKVILSNGGISPSIEEVNWLNIIKKTSPTTSEVGSFDDIPLSSNVLQGSINTSNFENDRVSLLKKFGALRANSVHQPVKLTKQNHIKTKDIDVVQHAMNNSDSIDYIISNNPIKEIKPSTRFSEQLQKIACNTIEPIEKQIASKISDLSSINNNFIDSPKSVESFDSLEENVSEIEGESLVDRLKRQVEYDKNLIKILRRELEEERNATSIAINETMAMINKLQEEKSSFSMEALQYLRMMEEQAEYDVDSLEKANDMIALREKTIQELESVLDYFRMKYPEEFPDMNEGISFVEDDEPRDSYNGSLEV